MANLVDKKEYGDKLISDYVNLFTSYSINNIEYAKLTLHVLIGQFLRNIYFRIGKEKLDIRTHMFFVNPERRLGTGLILDLFEELGMNTYKLDLTTKCGLAGAVDKYDSYRNEYIFNDGYLKDGNLILMENGSEILHETSSFSKTNLPHLFTSCNSIFEGNSKIKLKLGVGEPVIINPFASYILYSYPCEIFNEKLEEGKLKDFLVIIRDVGLEQRKLMTNVMFDNINISTEERYDDFYDSIVKRLKVIQNFYGTNQRIAIIDDDAKEHMREMSLVLIDDTKNYDNIRDVLEEYTEKINETIIKTSIHHALLRLSIDENERPLVKIEDAEYASKLIKTIWYRFVSWLLLSCNKEKTQFYIRNAIDVYKSLCRKNIDTEHIDGELFVKRTTLIEELLPMWDNISKNEATEIFSEIEKKERQRDPSAFFLRKKLGSESYVKLLMDI